MRRIYESEALHRDDDDPFAPRERSRSDRPQALRSVNASRLSRWLVPDWLKHRAISISVDAPEERVPLGTPVPFTVTFRNALPVPIRIPTRSPILWTWSVDGHAEASHVELHDPPDWPSGLELGRGQRVRYDRRWDQMFRVSESEWTPARPGEYTLGVAINVADAPSKGLSDETTVRIGP